MKILNLYAGIGGNRKLWGDEHEITAVEMEVNISDVYRKLYPNDKLIVGDAHKYLLENYEKFDLIIANPPFAKNQDITHIMKMWECLAEGGKIVTIASKHWQLSTNRKEVEFKKFLSENNAEIIEIEAGRFKESGTNISTVIIVLNKV